MKLSKIMHVGSVIAGGIGTVLFIVILLSSPNSLVFGITKVDALLCTGILILIAIWLQLATMHHMMLEKTGKII